MAPFAFAIFAGAFLLFQVQPLVGKYLLPWFGGGTGVWTTCLLFFQIFLLLGYAYAHLCTRLLKPRAQVFLHLALLVLALTSLRLLPPDSWKPSSAANPALRIITLLTLSVGLPYFVLSATAPLLQHWFSRLNPERSPFRLYALSNAGSLLALLSYPVVFETWFRRITQVHLWSAGLLVYALGCLLCATKVWNMPVAPLRQTATKRRVKPAIPPVRERATFQQQSLWLLLPACASVLLLGVTNKLCQEVAVIPLLWVLPLTAYLLSFIICFQWPQWYLRAWSGPALGLGVATLCWLLVHPSGLSIPVQVLLYTVGLLVCCIVCHGEVYRLRPEPAQLTSFYLVVAGGGALGALFVAVLAPLIFPDYFELQCGLLLCGTLFLLVCSGQSNRPRTPRWKATWAAGWLVLLLLGWIVWAGPPSPAELRAYHVRNFYGVLNVYRHDLPAPNSSFVELVHGRVAHGMQFLAPERSGLPTLYYTPRSGVGRAFQVLPAANRRVGIVGLGAGTLAAYGHAGDYFRFYEINPEVETVAKTYFTYLKNSAAQTSVVLGDARLSLERESPQNFELLVLDAFNGDAIPVHLLTEQAFQIYQRHLKPDGLIAVHISNFSLNLEPVLAAIAHDLGYAALVLEQAQSNEAQGLLPSTWVLLSRNPNLAQLAPLRGAAQLAVTSGSSAKPWTDEYSSLFAALRWPGGASAAQSALVEAAQPSETLAGDAALSTTIAGYREAIERQPDSPVALNNLACLLATSPDPAQRNGAQAVSYAQQACTLTGYTNAATLTTLAAAYAEAERFEEAAATAEKACKLAAAKPDPNLLQQDLRLLDLFKRKQPFHQALR